MDFIIEIIIEIILEGAIMATDSKKVPMPVRILLAFGLGVIFIGLPLLLLITGVNQKDVPLIVLAIILLILFTSAIIVTIKRKKQSK